MRLIDADNLRGRVCEIFLCAEPSSAEERRFALVLGLIDSELTIAPPPNEPLTLEELWEMDGNPVWDPNLSEWGIVDIHGFNDEGCVRYVNNWWHPRCLMSRRFYRQKLEEGQNE